jgi:predicted anti-sigma-YlaC factor YlaD
MKYKQYERWILDEAPLTDAQQQELDTHLKVCESCRVLRRNWITSKQLIMQSAMQVPASGFTDRWQTTYIKKCQIEKVRRYRLTLFGLILLAFASSVIYMLVSGSFMQMFANGFTMISEMVMGLTNGLSTIGYWLSRLPIAVPITAGFIFFGLINSFVMVGIFFLWNLKQRKLLTNEISVD